MGLSGMKIATKLWSFIVLIIVAICMVAVRVPWANNPPPRPIRKIPKANKGAEPKGPEAITAANAGTPTQAPQLAMR